MLVDVHCHLDSGRFADVDAVISRAEAAGVVLMINNGISPESNQATLSLAKRHHTVKAALGLHPSDWLHGAYISKANINEEVEKELNKIRLHKKEIVAIGEVGLDYYWVKDEAEREEQRALFAKMIMLAEELEKPLIVHSRAAEDDVLELLNCKVPVVLHCFNGSSEAVRIASAKGCYFSIPASIARDNGFQELVRNANISHLLTETDSPLLSPVRGAINEPANVSLAVQKIAEIKGLDAGETGKIIFSNCQRVFLMGN